MMILSTQIEYRTSWGEDVRVVGSAPELGNWNAEQACSLSTVNGILWTLNKEISVPTSGNIEYTYVIFSEGKPVRQEWDAFPRHIDGCKEKQTYRFHDVWRNIPLHQFYYSSAFTDCWLRRKRKSSDKRHFVKSIILKVFAPRVGRDQVLGIVGNQEVLGLWNAEKVVKMNDYSYPEWEVELNAAQIKYPLEYKFVVWDTKSNAVVDWEESWNRVMGDPGMHKNETVVVSDMYANFRMSEWKGAGTAIPVFSLKSEESCGIGDFSDLKKMVDWVSLTNQKVLQILPVNDTTITHTWTDSYPYSAISIYALHPLYMDLKSLGKLKDTRQEAIYRIKQKKLNALNAVDYEAVSKFKWEYFELIFKQEGRRVLNSVEFSHFYSDNKEWLQPYAAFCIMRDKNNTANFREWKTLSTYNKEEVEKICNISSPIYEKIELIYYVQYNLHKQLNEASTYAREHGVALKGDIPIGINRNSVEAWTEPHYFNLNGQAGAPPDDFSANGQNWGFPTYNWDVMSKDGFQWWMKRFQKMSQYFQAYRIDHILGFFRIWEIPANAVHGLLGQFSPALPMSKEEIEQYGMHFQEELFTEPYIRDYFLNEVFGQHTEKVKSEFLEKESDSDVYHMKPQFDTQKKVEAYFAGKTDASSVWIRDGLYSLISDVLFLRDHKNPTLYHPRISVQFEYIYNSLSPWDKDAFNRLYDHYYYHRHNNFWAEQAMEKLPRLTQSTRMLVCGEDLGMIPACVNWVMDQLQILSLEVQRMPKQRNREFGWPGDYPYSSVCTISSHDTSTLRGWWKEDKEKTQRYYNYILKHDGAAPEDATTDLCSQVLKQHLESPSMLCILTFQDWLSINERLRNPNIEGERINVPADPHHYWRYRMHVTLEELLHADELNTQIRELVHQTGRDMEY